MYLVSRVGGFSAQEKLWTYVADEMVRLLVPEVEEWQRMRALMRQYKDVPMDVADASLVAAAERLELHRIFTLDSHFYVHRIGGIDTFEVTP